MSGIIDFLLWKNKSGTDVYVAFYPSFPGCHVKGIDHNSSGM